VTAKTIKAPSVVNSIQLRNVRLLRLATESLTSITDEAKKNAQLQVKWDHREKRTKTGFNVYFHGIATVTSPAKPRAPLFSIVVTLELVYVLAPGVQLKASEIEAFAEVNAVHNAWPYWRELVQNVTVRMQLPPLILPLFRIRDIPGEEDHSKKKHDPPKTQSAKSTAGSK
jgi:preprotein translocase subunit SecB